MAPPAYISLPLPSQQLMEISPEKFYNQSAHR